METDINTYCRFCAEPKSSEKLLNLNERAKHDDIMAKLNFLNTIFNNVFSCDSLPKSVCFVCYGSLNKAYDSVKEAYAFLESVKRANLVLNAIITEEKPSYGIELEIPKVECIKVEEPIETFIFEDEIPISEVKTEISDAETGESDTDSKEKVTGNDDDWEKKINNWSDYQWICDICRTEFVNMDMLRSHVQIVHSKCCAHYCVDCEGSIKDDFNVFIRHVRQHQKRLRNICYYCNKKYPTDELDSHILQHTKNKRVCPHCGEILNNKEMLTIHKQKYKVIKKRKRTKKIYPKKKPVTPIKVTIEDVTCKECKKVFKTPVTMKIHMEQWCSLKVSDRKNDFVCDQCGKTFHTKGGLTSHLLSHVKVQPHVCKICKRSFRCASALRKHVLTHSGDKPYCCEQCGKHFRLATQLNSHRIVHTDLMPYSCQFCDKKFRYKNKMKNHERQHTGEHPYSCEKCDIKFVDWSNYNKHMKRRHNMNMAKKKVTPQGVLPINPKTGEVMEVEVPEDTEEWKAKIMTPRKRGERYQEYEIVG